MQRVFTASWDKWVWIITIVVVALLGLLPIGIIANALTGGQGNRIPIMIAVLMLLILAVGYLFSPQAYAVEPGNLIVQRPGTDVTIPLAGIQRIEIVPGWPIFRGAIRLFASGGAFGFYGGFWNSTLKRFIAYATRMDKVIILYRTNGNPIVVSPDEPEEFVRLVEQARKR